MKILLINNTDSGPLAITANHLQQIKNVSDKIEVKLVSTTHQEELDKNLADAEIVAGRPANIPPISSTKNLKWIHSFSAGADKILTEEVKKSDVIVSNSSGIHAIPIAEHVLGLMLIFTRKFYDTFRKQQQKIWQNNQDATELRGKTVLVVGLGHIGEEVARLVNLLGANVIGIKNNIKDKPDFMSEIYTSDQIDSILPKADFTVLCLPLTLATHHLFNLSKFKKMKKSSVIINIGRGELINEKELIQALEEKIIAGAGLDVTEEEPLPKESKLWNMENVVITPHHSGLSEKYMDRAIDLFCINLKAYLERKKLPNSVDKDKGY
ncbi:MAG: D-2-hydroxyacid dehydrogenase [Candidatus Levybacteria bacterium]|nr:D-2-hydroxyacid dehydrogenase [Candidatus Levybacteria bacterium]